MAKAKPTAKPPMPSGGGSSVRNPKTGALTPLEADAPPPTAPSDQEN